MGSIPWGINTSGLAHNAMLSYLKTWRKQSRYRLFGENGRKGESIASGDDKVKIHF